MAISSREGAVCIDWRRTIYKVEHDFIGYLFVTKRLSFTDVLCNLLFPGKDSTAIYLPGDDAYVVCCIYTDIRFLFMIQCSISQLVNLQTQLILFYIFC